MTEQQINAIAAWEHAKAQLDVLRDQEMKLRLDVVNSMFKAEKVEGTETFKLNNGWKLKATKALNYNVKRDPARALEALLPADVAAALFRWNPEVNVAAYKNALPLYRNTIQDPALSAKITEALIDAITIKPGAPSLELVPPKEEK